MRPVVQTIAMKIFLKSAISVIFLSVLLYSCETDFDTITKYEDITVVYGVLDQKSPDQYIKINKAFLSETNVLTYASDPDSNQYMFDLDVWMEEWTLPESEGGQFVKRYEFDTTAIYDKEPGLFYYPDQILYNWIRPDFPLRYENVMLGSDTLYRIPIWLNEDHTYKLFVQNPKTGKVISSETQLVNNFNITKPGFGLKINFVPEPIAPKTFSWNTAANGKKYEFELRFNYRELKNGSSDTTSKVLLLARGVSNAPEGAGELSTFYWDDNFYSTCQSLIPYSDPSLESQIKERYTDMVEIMVKVAAEELTLYMDVNAPSTGIIQEKPEYSNIDNGYGIFSSRVYRIKMKELDDQTKAELKKYDLKFRY